MIPDDTIGRAVDHLFATLETHLDHAAASYSRDDDRVATTATALTTALLAGGWVPPVPETSDSDPEPDETGMVIWVEFGLPRRPCRQRRIPRAGR